LLSFFSAPEDLFGTENLVWTVGDGGSLMSESNCLGQKNILGVKKDFKSGPWIWQNILKDARFMVYQLLALWLGLNKFLGIFLASFLF
jgi:hypothetical protein